MFVVDSLLSNEPDVFVTKLDHNVDYLLLATDVLKKHKNATFFFTSFRFVSKGLFEYLSHEEIKDFIAHQRETGEHLQVKFFTILLVFVDLLLLECC